MKYPYQKAFFIFCRSVKHYSERTIILVNKSIASFWQYYTGNTSQAAALDNIHRTDIQNYLDVLETQVKLKKNTINKYLSHIRLYFKFLYTHHLVKNYPMLEINGRKFDHTHTYQIDWMKELPAIAKIQGIHAQTVKMMLGISLGYLPEQVLKLRWQNVSNKIKDPVFKKYIKDHLNFDQDSNPYLLSKKSGGPYASDFHLVQETKPDRPLIGMNLTLQNLRLSYVYSILSNPKYSDEQLERILHVNAKSLLYYRQNMMRYNTLEEFTLPENNNKKGSTN